MRMTCNYNINYDMILYDMILYNFFWMIQNIIPNKQNKLNKQTKGERNTLMKIVIIKINEENIKYENIEWLVPGS